MNVVKWLTTSTMASYRLYELQSPEEAGKEGPPSLLLSYFLICRGLPVRKPVRVAHPGVRHTIFSDHTICVATASGCQVASLFEHPQYLLYGTRL
jgi:hypothetical protein